VNVTVLVFVLPEVELPPHPKVAEMRVKVSIAIHKLFINVAPNRST
jgi:hypothetical protein